MRVETVVGQACESLIAYFRPVLSYVVQPFRALSWRGGAARVETNTADPLEANPPVEQTPVPGAALTRVACPGLPDEQWNEGCMIAISKQSSYPAQHELSEWAESLQTGVPPSTCAVNTTSLEHRFDQPAELSCEQPMSCWNEGGGRSRETSASEN